MSFLASRFRASSSGRRVPLVTIILFYKLRVSILDVSIHPYLLCRFGPLYERGNFLLQDLLLNSFLFFSPSAIITARILVYSNDLGLGGAVVLFGVGNFIFNVLCVRSNFPLLSLNDLFNTLVMLFKFEFVISS